MATVYTKVSDLPAASTIDGSELVPVVQAGVTSKVTLVNLVSTAADASALVGSEDLSVIQSGVIAKVEVNDLLAFVPTTGLILTYVGTTSFSVGTGFTSDDTHVEFMKMLSTYTKTTADWAAGTGVGGKMSAAAIANNTWYYVYAIKNPTTGLVDWGFDVSPTAPTLPSGYTFKRLIGAVKTNGSAQFRQWIGYSDGTQEWVDSIADVADTTLTTTRKNYTMLTVPPVTCRASLYLVMVSATAAPIRVSVFGNTNITDVAPNDNPNVTVSTSVANVAYYSVSQLIILSGIIYARSTAASTTLNAAARDFNIRPFN